MNKRNYYIVISILVVIIALFWGLDLTVKFFSPKFEGKEFSQYRNREILSVIPEVHTEAHNRLINIGNELGMKPLIDSRDSIAIRIWINVDSFRYKYVFSMTSNNNEWQGKLSFFMYDRRAEKIYNQKILKLKPVDSWEKVYSILLKNGIFVLPNFKDINVNYFIDDGFNFFIEVLNDKYYRFYDSHIPDIILDQSFECYYFNNIFEYLNNEFDINNRYEKYIASTKKK